MPTPEPQDEKIARQLWDDMKQQAQDIAKIRGMAPGNKKLTPDEERTLYMTEAKGWSPEQEAMMLASGKSREEVGLAKYPHREKLAKSDGRALSKYEQARYHADMARKIDPLWQPPQTKAQAPPLPPGVDPEAGTTMTPPEAPPIDGGASLMGG